jgi:hypothetical protein
LVVSSNRRFGLKWNFVELGLLFPKAKRILNGLGEQGADRNGTHLADAFDAERIGLTVAQTLLATADDVIE